MVVGSAIYTLAGRHHAAHWAELRSERKLIRLRKIRRSNNGDANMARILVVDDDPMVCMAIEVYLARHKFDVVIAEGGEAGMRALDDGSFDVMLVDIFMPHMRGFESIRIFHERAPSVPLIAMSGYAFANLNAPAPDFLRMALELGASHCLRKPFTPDALVAVINECLAEARIIEPGTSEDVAAPGVGGLRDNH
jgi:DNA-binding response OmpR family regulator